MQWELLRASLRINIYIPSRDTTARTLSVKLLAFTIDWTMKAFSFRLWFAYLGSIFQAIGICELKTPVSLLKIEIAAGFCGSPICEHIFDISIQDHRLCWFTNLKPSRFLAVKHPSSTWPAPSPRRSRTSVKQRKRNGESASECCASQRCWVVGPPAIGPWDAFVTSLQHGLEGLRRAWSYARLSFGSEKSWEDVYHKGNGAKKWYKGMVQNVCLPGKKGFCGCSWPTSGDGWFDPFCWDFKW